MIQPERFRSVTQKSFRALAAATSTTPGRTIPNARAHAASTIAKHFSQNSQ